jgi:hypothetical protein
LLAWCRGPTGRQEHRQQAEHRALLWPRLLPLLPPPLPAPPPLIGRWLRRTSWISPLSGPDVLISSAPLPTSLLTPLDGAPLKGGRVLFSWEDAANPAPQFATGSGSSTSAASRSHPRPLFGWDTLHVSG